LAIVGDIDPAQTLAEVKKWFEPIPRRTTPLERWPKMAVTLDAEKTQLVEADVRSPRIVYSWPAPARFTPGWLDVDGAASFASGVIFDEMGALTGKLVDVDQAARGVWYSYDALELAGVVSLTVTLPPGDDPMARRAAVDETMARLSAYRFARNDVLRTSVDRAAREVFGLEEIAERANAINRFARFLGEPDYAPRYIDDLETADPTAWRDAYRSQMVQANAVVTFVKPTPGAPRGGRLAWTH
jgi:predicted Zn-dependent peptidase